MSDKYNVWNGKRFVFTINKLCGIIFDDDNFPLPEGIKVIADKALSEVIPDKARKKNGIRVVFDVFCNQKASEQHIIDQARNGIIVITPRKITDVKGKEIATIYCESPYDAWVKLGQYVKGVFPMPTIGITGSAGKTTTTMLADCVFSERYKTFLSGKNGQNLNNLIEIVNQWILRCTPEYNFHIQECGGGTPKLVEREATAIGADVYGITNIDTAQHLATYKTADNLIKDKTSFDRVRKDGTVGVINIDDDILARYPFEGTMVTFGIKNKEGDYYAENISQKNNFLEFDIVSREGITNHFKINIVGKDNVYNALMVYAFAKLYDFTDEEIQRGFLKYRSLGIRQRLDYVGGKYLYVDCFNASITSIHSSISALEDFKLPEGGRKIAIIGERDCTNEEVYNYNYETGRELAKYEKVDEFIILGENKPVLSPEGKVYDMAIYEGAKTVIPEDKLSFFRNKKLLADKLNKETKPGDAILIKGKLALNMFCIFDIAYGTSYTLERAIKPADISTTALECQYYPLLLGANLKKFKQRAATVLTLPTAVEGHNIVRIGEKAFYGHSLLRRIVMGEAIRAVNKEAFSHCIVLDRIELPKSTIYIGEGAFKGCSSLTFASLPGVEHISNKTFKDCSNLKKVVLSSMCATIEEDAFEGCEVVTIYAPSNSYAQQFAEQKGINFIEINEEDMLAQMMKNGTPKHVVEKYYCDETTSIDGKQVFCDDNQVKLSIVACGDVMTHGGQLTSALNPKTGEYTFDNYFVKTKKYFQLADVAICNLETTFGPGAYTGFPKFNTPDYMAESIAKAGIDVAACANNHSYDTKYAGIVRTRKFCEQNGIAVTGTRKTEQEKAFCVIERKGVKVAILNYTYRTEQQDGKKTLNLNVIDEDSLKLLNTFSFETLDKDLIDIQNQIEEAKAEGADVVLLYYHWGCEYECCSNVLQKYMAYKTAYMGADLILGSHPHVLQEKGQIVVKEEAGERVVPVYYSLGNYVWGGFPMFGRESVLNTALADVEILYDKDKKRVENIEAKYVPLKIEIEFKGGKWNYNVLSLNDLTSEECEAYDSKNTDSVETSKQQIYDTFNCKSLTHQEMRFDKTIEIVVGTKYNVVGDIIWPEELCVLKSENAIIASVLQDGNIIGNSPGYVGITAIKPDGGEIYFMVHVTPSIENIAVPPLVNEYNSVTDLYRPVRRVSGVKYLMPTSCIVAEETALAWMKMRKDAERQKINIGCTVGYVTNKEQLLRIIYFAETRSMDEALNRYYPQGCTDHHTGYVIDVRNNISTEIEEKVSSFSWLIENAHKYGFAVRKPKGGLADLTHLHLRYYRNNEIAKILKEEDITLEQYLEKYL